MDSTIAISPAEAAKSRTASDVPPRRVNYLDDGYSVEIDQVDKEQWHEWLSGFEDASFYQTWSYGLAQWGDRQLSHVVLKRDGRVVAMAQLRVLAISVLRLGTAYLNWGPIWKPAGEVLCLQHLQNMLRALRAEYSVRRGYLLRITPRIPDSDESRLIRTVIENEGYTCNPDPLETIILDLSPPLDELRRSLRRNWRRCLTFAEQQALEVTDDAGEESCALVLKIVDEMVARKQFQVGGQGTVISAHRGLPERLKLRISVCRHQGEPVAVLGWTTFGNVGAVLISATRDQALKLNAAFLLYWRMVQYYKAHGFSAVDLTGVNKERNPGGFYFKTGLAGQNFKEPNRFIGQFDACDNPVSGLAGKIAYGFKDLKRRAMHRITKTLRTLPSSRKPASSEDCK